MLCCCLLAIKRTESMKSVVQAGIVFGLGREKNLDAKWKGRRYWHLIVERSASANWSLASLSLHLCRPAVCVWQCAASDVHIINTNATIKLMHSLCRCVWLSLSQRISQAAFGVPHFFYCVRLQWHMFFFCCPSGHPCRQRKLYANILKPICFDKWRSLPRNCQHPIRHTQIHSSCSNLLVRMAWQWNAPKFEQNVKKINL